jgi:ribosomal protein S12 methylthiotransferase accessory factor
MDMQISLAGGKRVDALFEGFTVHTDQSLEHGGEGSAPEPFSLFLAALGTCAGLYVAGFCQTRGIPTAGVRLSLHTENDPSGKKLATVELVVHVPESFPAEQREAVARAAAACKVKKTLFDPPEFNATTHVGSSPPATAPRAA